MNLTLVAIAALIVVGTVAYLILARREEAKRFAQVRSLNKQLWERILKQYPDDPAVRARAKAELESLSRADHEAKTQAVVERSKK